MSRLPPLAAAGLLAVVLAAPAVPLAAQCAMCKATLEGSEEGRRVSAELNRAILLMLAAPYAVFSTCAAVVFRRRIGAFLKTRLFARR